ncbi:MAG: biosynthetic-type acetolactate synthase large subunit [Nitrososphaeria archaeon]|jgi:acetolactate synthase-1/2/3 large subunit
MSGSRALIKALEREGVDVVFGIPGGAIMPVYDELLNSGLRHVLARHEQSAAHMADGYARASGRVGVCMATSGPGATNLLTGVATAYLDSTPLVAITGQVPTHMMGRDAFQEIDAVGIYTHVTKYSFQPQRPEEIPWTVRAAFFLASTGRTGPVHIDLPKDVQTGEAEMAFPDAVEIRGYRPYVPPDPAAVARALDMLLESERPIILAGGGVIKSGAHDYLLQLAESALIPVASTLMGKGAIPEDHPLALGLVGMHGTVQANKLVNEADLILAIGVRFSDRTTMEVRGFAPDARIVHFDVDPTEVSKNVRASHAVIGDLRSSLKLLLEMFRERARTGNWGAWRRRVNEVSSEWRDRILGTKSEFSPPYLLKAMREVLPPGAIVATEVGQNQMWAALYFRALRPRTFITSGGLGTMGFGFPAAIGAKAARPDVPVVDIAGDGSFMMTMNSLATSIDEKLPVIVVILNNSSLGMVAQWQRLFYNRRYAATLFGANPDFVRLAESFGAEGVRVYSLDEFRSALARAMRTEVTTVIDVPIHPEEDVFPFVGPGSTLSEVMLGDGRE